MKKVELKVTRFTIKIKGKEFKTRPTRKWIDGMYSDIK